jgi:membrane peptidoglycan carboxypeptidase
MSEHRRKPPQSNGGGRAAGRRGAQPPPSGRRAGPPQSGSGSHGGGGNTYGTGSSPASRGSYGAGTPAGSGSGGVPDRPYGGRAEARRAAQRSGRRRAGGAGGGGRRGNGGHGPGDGRGGRGGRGPNGPGPKRIIDYPRSGKYGWQRWVPSWKQSFGICVAFCGTMIGLVGIAYLMVNVPDPNAAAQTQKNVYYWADGSRMVVSGGGDLNRQIVGLDKIPKSMQNAVVSAENANFWHDSGVDPQGIARAIVKMAQGGETQSGSTITQQYVKNTYLDQSQTVTRKLKELLISVKVGATKSKSFILAGYLNTGYYGRGAYGIQAAAQAYYGINCDQLSPSQSAFLGALLNGPNLYDPAGGVGPGATPAENLKRGSARWSWILNREVATGDLTPAARAQYKTFPMPQKPKPSTDKAGQIGYLTDLADNNIVANTKISKEELDRGGYQIYTTFDKKDVGYMQKAVNTVRSASIKPKLRPKTDTFVQFGGASVVPGDGAIRAIYGGEDYLKHFTDNADYTGAQVGSTFKPFVLAAAMQDGVRNPKDPIGQPDTDRTPVSPSSVYPGVNHWKVLNYDGSVWTEKNGKEWLQPNDENDNFKSITLKKAMELSVNSTYVQLGMDVGLDKVEQSALAAGVTRDSLASAAVPSFSIGTSSPSAIRMADAYSTFADSGMHVEPYSVSKVMYEGSPAYQHKTNPVKAYDAAVADNVTNVLRGVVQEGTGTAARALGRPAAGKTGTTDSNESAWFTGFTPQLATSIGMYRVDDQSSHQRFLPMYGLGGNAKIYGASFPTQIWTQYMKLALDGQPVQQFNPPAKIGTVVFGHGASPSPTPTVSATPSQSPSGLPSGAPTSSASPGPNPTSTCGVFGCTGDGGPGGGPGGTTPTPTTGPDGGGDNRGNNNGGLFGGPNG